MKTPHPESLLELYLQGELEDADAERVEAWLAMQPDSDRRLQQARSALEKLDEQLVRPDDMEAFTRQTVSAVGDDARPIRRLTPWLGMTALAATLVLGVMWWRAWSGSEADDSPVPGWSVAAGPGTDWMVLSPGRVELTSGELWLASKRASNDAPLVIETPHGTATTQGTRCWIGATGSRSREGVAMHPLTRLVVMAGVVTLSAPLGSVTAQEGEAAWTLPDSAPKTWAGRRQNDLAFRLYDTFRQTDGNVTYSPYSVAQACALLAVGAKGDTLEALAELLGIPDELRATVDGDGLAKAAMQLAMGFGELNRGFQQPGAQVHLSVANGLFADVSTPLRPDLASWFGQRLDADVRELDFLGHPKRSLKEVNAWVAQRTGGHIDELFRVEEADAGWAPDAMILANAVHFMAAWQEPFEPAAAGDFTLSDGTEVSVPMMFRETSVHEQRDDGLYSRDITFPYATVQVEGEDVQVLSLPYRDDSFSMMLVLPSRADGLPAVEAALNAETWNEWEHALEEVPVRVRMPKFELSSRVDLTRALKAVGGEALFASGGVEEFFAEPAGEFLSEAVHETWLKVTETGTEAAAATGMRIRKLSLEHEFTANRPFLFGVRDHASGALLFLGRVLDPRDS